MKFIIIALMFLSSICYHQYNMPTYQNSCMVLQDKYPKMKRSWYCIIDRETKTTVFENREICAVIDYESAQTWNPSIVSCAGAVGLMQIMPYHGVKDRTDPEQNLVWGISHLQTRCIPAAHGIKTLAFALYHGGCNRKFLRSIDQKYVIEIMNRV